MCKDSFSGTGGHFQLPDMLAEALVLCFLNIFGKKRREMAHAVAYNGFC